MTNFIPNKKQLLVERTEELNVTKGGIYLPDQAKERPTNGTIKAIHPSDPDFQIGQVVYFASYSGHELTLDDQKYTVLHRKDVLGSIPLPVTSKAVKHKDGTTTVGIDVAMSTAPRAMTNNWK